MQQTIITPNQTIAAGPDGTSIKIEVRSVYGESKAYPVCDRARLFAQIAGTRTLTRATLELVQQLGFEIVSMADASWSRVR